MDNLKKQLLDKLKRAHEMEEAMSGTLIDLCAINTPIDGLAPELQQRISKILNNIKKDTLKHKKIITEIKETLFR